MIINNLGINFAGGGGSTGGTAVLTADTFTENSTYTPPTGVDGYSAVTVNVDVVGPYNSGYTEGYVSGTTDGAAAQKALLSSTTINDNGVYTSENGFSAVTVDVQAGGNRLNEYFTNQVTAITQSDLSGMTSLPDNCFKDKTAIKTIDLPSSITSIGAGAIQNTGIETIDVSHVTSYGNNYNFYGNKSLTGITGFENYKGSMRPYMFNRCSALTGDFRTSVSSMAGANEAFYECFNITSFTFLENIDNIAEYSWSNPFNKCSGVTYIDLTNNYKVPTLGFATAFSAFKPDYEIRVPDVLYDSWTAATNWSDSAVVGHIVPCASTLTYRGIKYHTTGSTEITFPGVTGYTFTSSTFDSTSGWGEKKFFGMTTVPKNAISSSNNSVTDIVLGEGIKRVNDSAFAYCSALTAVTFPSTIEFIDTHWKLFGSNNFNTMTINAVTPPALGSLAFKDGNYASNGTLYVPRESVSAYQTWLTQDAAYSIRNWTVTGISPYADCKITTTAASETVKIGYTYNDLAALADVLVDGVSVKSSLVDDTYTFADAGTHIVRYVYTSSTATDVTRQVDRLESYEASKEVLDIGQNALNMYQAANPSQLASISLPGVELIDYQGITNTIATDIYAPKVTLISNKALQFNPNLDPVSIPLSNVMFIGNNALRQSAIKEAHFGPALTTYDYNVFNECYSLSALTFDGVTGLTSMPSVGDKTYDLTEIVFPDSITTYAQDTMSYGMITNSKNLQSVTFGSGATTMQGLLFKGDVSALTEIKCYATTAPSIVSGCFGPVTANTGTLYVPSGSDYSTWAAELGSNWTVSDTL